MFEVKTGAGQTVKIPSARVALIADRLWRLPIQQRDVRLERARKRMAGKHPDGNDAAIVALAHE